MCKSLLKIIRIDFSDIYPENCVTDAIERKLSSTLPSIPGMNPSLSSQERLHVYDSQIVAQRTAFFQIHGNFMGSSVSAVLSTHSGSHRFMSPEKLIDQN